MHDSLLTMYHLYLARKLITTGTSTVIVITGELHHCQQVWSNVGALTHSWSCHANPGDHHLSNGFLSCNLGFPKFFPFFIVDMDSIFQFPAESSYSQTRNRQTVEMKESRYCRETKNRHRQRHANTQKEFKARKVDKHALHTQKAIHDNKQKLNLCRIIGMLMQFAAATAAKGPSRATSGAAFYKQDGLLYKI